MKKVIRGFIATVIAICITTSFSYTLKCCCSHPSQTQEEDTEPDSIIEYIEVDSLCNTPECVIYLLPYNDFTQEETEKLLPVLKKKFGKMLYGYWDFRILPNKSLPNNSYINAIDRYKATSILDYEKTLIKETSKWEMIIGLTHKDICMDIHGKKNYGIIGCSYRPGYICIVSDKRVKNKKDYWKPIMHEFIHAFYNEGHCPEDNNSCIMQEGKGKGDFSNKEILCNSCKH